MAAPWSTTRSVASFETDRQYGQFQSSVLPRQFKDSLYLMQRLKLVSSLKHHTGCVNTIAWNEGGRTLVSGSDDCHLVVTDPFHKRVLCSIPTEHRSNIFSAKFLPLSCNYRLVSCAGNGTVQYTEVDPAGGYMGHIFNCHTSITYQVVTTPVDGHEFLSCEEKGLVRLFDLRTKNKCNCSGCDKDVIYSTAHAVTCMGVNPRLPYYFALGVSDGTVRVVDRRMMAPRRPSSVVQFRPPTIHPLGRLTAVQFDSTGSEILASYSEEHIYLFNFQDPRANPLVHCRSKNRQMEACVSGCRRWRGKAAGKRENVKCAAVPKSPISPVAGSSHSDDRGSGSRSHRGMPPMKRLRLRGDWSDTGPEAQPEEVRSNTVNGVMQRMSAILASWMEGTLSTEEGSDENGPTPEQQGDTALTPASSSSASSVHSNPSPHTFSVHTHATSEGSTPVLPSAASTGPTPPPSPGALSSSFAASCSTSSPKKHSLPPLNEKDTLDSAPTVPVLESSPDRVPLVNIEVEPCSDSESSAVDHYDPIPESGTLQSAVKHSASDCVDNTDCSSPVRGATATEPDDSLQPFICYKGHRNTRTMIKQANFWGDNYVMSGSDCGRVFIWDKWTGRVVNVLVGDRRVVNCVQPHPEAFMLATSGIDYDVKLWEPCASEPCQLDNLQEIVERNERMLRESRNTVTVPSVFLLRFLSYLSRRRRQGGDQSTDAEVDAEEDDSDEDNH